MNELLSIDKRVHYRSGKYKPCFDLSNRGCGPLDPPSTSLGPRWLSSENKISYQTEEIFVIIF